MTAQIKKLLGPPGTGKTHNLLKYVEEEIKTTYYEEDDDEIPTGKKVGDIKKQGVPIEKVGYFSFSRKAASEARDRAVDQLGLDKKEFKWFSTLHSCGYKSIRVEGRTVMQLPQYQAFAAKLGLRSKMYVDSDTGMSDDEYLNHYNLARSRKLSLKKHYQKYVDESSIQWKTLQRVATGYETFKEVNNYIDYTDMLYESVEEELLPVLDVVFIDEAQDLTLLQWSMVDHFARTAKRLYLAGDDDQAIYRWLGADVEKFINYPGEEIVLPKSFRVKRKIQVFAQQIISGVKNRIKKEWEPLEEEGELFYHERPGNIDLSDGKWLVLARDKYILENLEEDFRGRGLWYEKLDRKKIIKPIPQRMFSAIVAWKALSNGEMIDKKTLKKIFYYRAKPEDFDDKIKTFSDKDTFDLQSLEAVFGSLGQGEWYNTLNKINVRDKAYLFRLENTKDDVFQTPRIRLSTIHGAKGGQCAKVLLATDMSKKTYIEYKRDSDDEHRVWYVGSTRAQDELHILAPQTKLYFSLNPL
tara:strand:- start:2632 stop:4206 length:1575 start_codon:yes stop_codon:yes gene_type:complete